MCVENQMNGRDLPVRLSHQDPRSSSSPCYPITLKIRSTTATTEEERTILNRVTGIVSPGEFMAVLGPSGSGKSTLLNAIAGRLHHGSNLTGEILADSAGFTKQRLKRTGFVAQDNLLYPHLTVRETLIFVALLRLPENLTRDEKIRSVESVINEFGLEKCEDTVVGNSFVRGISTSGLDATAAQRLIQTLSRLARAKGKTVEESVCSLFFRGWHVRNVLSDV
ncbi:unnamed protein product [Cochlearia groenlandica]